MVVGLIIFCTLAILGSHLFFIQEHENIVNLLNKVLKEIEELKELIIKK